MRDSDPEKHTFRVRPVEKNDFGMAARGTDVLEITLPTDNPRWVQTNMFGLTTPELVDLRDEIDRRLEEQSG